MKKKLRIGVLHYHLLRGGTHTVIANTLRGLIAHSGYDHLEIDLIACDAQQSPGNELADQLNQWARAKGSGDCSLNQIELPLLAYNQTPAPDKDALFHDARYLADQIRSALQLQRSDRANPYVLHCHNANLGKNPRLTLALKFLAEQIETENLPGLILYQMHDFPEDNRLDCWAALRDCSGRPDRRLAVSMAYPLNSPVRWLCINSADAKSLADAGIPQDTVSILPNSIDTQNFTAEPLSKMSPPQLGELAIEPADFAAELKNRLADFAHRNSYQFDPARKILLAPIKVIRRKNVAESILLLLALNRQHDQYQLLITLPANSPADAAYCQLLEQFVKRHRLPVVIGFGSELLAGHQRHISAGRVEAYSLIDLLDISHAVLTTSIQEGFGYVFHEPWLVGKPVLGRNIAHLTADFVAQGLNLDHLYDHLLIPFQWIAPQWDDLCFAYGQKINAMRAAAELTPLDDSQIARLIHCEKTYRPGPSPSSYHRQDPSRPYNRSPDDQDALDWADLTVTLQLLILERLIKHPLLINHLIWTNLALQPLYSWFPNEISAIIPHNGKVVASSYNLQIQAERLTSLIAKTRKSVGGSVRGGVVRTVDNGPIFARALDLENLRLLA